MNDPVPEQLALPLAPPRPPPTRARKRCKNGHDLVRLGPAPGTEGMGLHPFRYTSGIGGPLYDCRCSRCGEEFRWILTEHGAKCCHATETP